ncbi:MAG: hypothetical protein ABIH67_03130 [Candidatus Uhrbacteria bacterium]
MDKISHMVLFVSIMLLAGCGTAGKNINSSLPDNERAALVFTGSLEGVNPSLNPEFKAAYEMALALHYQREEYLQDSELSIEQAESVWEASPFTSGTRFFWWNKDGFKPTRSLGIRVSEGQWEPVLDFGFRWNDDVERIHRFGPLIALAESVPGDMLEVYDLSSAPGNRWLTKWLDRMPAHAPGNTIPDEAELISLANLDLDNDPEMLVRYGWNECGGHELFVLYDWDKDHYRSISKYDVVYY